MDPPRGHSLLLPFRGLLQSRVRIAAERTHSGTAPQQIIPANLSPVAERKARIHFCARRPLCGRQNEERSMADTRRRFYDFDSQLNDEENWCGRQRGNLSKTNYSIIEKHSREATFPKHLVPHLRTGFLREFARYGCAGMSNVAYGLMTQELSVATPDCGVCSCRRAGMYPILPME